MKSKPCSYFAIILAMILFTHSVSAQQCQINRPGQNLCDGNQGAYLTNTASSITIHDAGRIPANGLYNITISYYKQSTSTCQPIINCNSSTVNSSGSDVTIYLNGCANLPANFQNEGIIYINLTDGPGGSYFFHIYGGSCILPLPVVLTAFNVQHTTIGNMDVVRVTWTTAQEWAFDKFVIERGSTAGNLNFDMDLGAVAGTNTSMPHSYEFIDYYPKAGNNYYRLRIVDQDGSFTHSQFKGAHCANCNQNPPQQNCTGINIMGPSQVCLSAPFKLSTPVYYSTYTWTTSYNASMDNPNARTVNVTQHEDAPGWVSVSLSNCTPATKNKTKLVNLGQPFEAYHTNEWVGSSPVPLLLANQGVNYNTEGQIIVAINTPFGVPITPSFVIGDPISWQWQASSQRLITFMTYNNFARFRFDLETACGPRSYEFDLACTAGMNLYTLSPNPASSQLNLYVDDRKLEKLKLKRSMDQNIQQVIISDKSGNTVYQQKYPVNTRNISVNIAALKADMYSIRVFDGKKWTAMKFIKK